jgi:hypothetical protein
MPDVAADPRYPIGRFRAPEVHDAEARRGWITDIAGTPRRLREAVAGWSPEQVDTPYRGGGWTVRQLVHHVADSHMNAYVRFKLAMTEEQPAIKPYREDLWAELADSFSTPVETSLQLTEALHARWVALMESMAESDFDRSLLHPEWSEPPRLYQLAAMYAWHGRHHVAHVTSLANRMGW